MIIIKRRLQCRVILSILLLTSVPYVLPGQKAQDTLSAKVTLQDCITYALQNQAQVKQAIIDEAITRKDIGISLSGWYPQLEFDANVQRYIQIPDAYYPNLLDPTAPSLKFPGASRYSSAGIFSANQALYNSNLLYASRNAGELRRQSEESTRQMRIRVYVDVNKAFFDVLLTEEELKVLDEDILRLQRNYKDAYNLYQNGLTDKIDFQRASIGLSNVRAQRRSAEESVKAKYAVLKQVMGVPPEKQLSLSYDSTKFENEILIDTAKVLDYNNRVEFQLMQSSLNMQNYRISYFKYSFIPVLSAYFNYSPQFGNSQFTTLYDSNNPSSVIGLKLIFPLFQGMQRIENLGKAKLQYSRLQLGMDYLKSQISSEYSNALARYLSNLNELKTAKLNILTARNIYNTVKLQYERGVKAYLEVLVSETDLRSAELNYLDILFQVLSSKVDLEKALGTIQNI